jgi:hypothetical protein
MFLGISIKFVGQDWLHRSGGNVLTGRTGPDLCK